MCRSILAKMWALSLLPLFKLILKRLSYIMVSPAFSIWNSFVHFVHFDPNTNTFKWNKKWCKMSTFQTVFFHVKVLPGPCQFECSIPCVTPFKWGEIWHSISIGIPITKRLCMLLLSTQREIKYRNCKDIIGLQKIYFAL